MKSIIKTKFEKMLLAVNVSDEKTAKLMDIMRAYGGEVKSVGADCGGQQLGYLLGFTGFKESGKVQSVMQEFIVFSGIDGGELNGILRQMRENGASVALKAICTAHNQRWTASQLAQELEQEHKAMTRGDKVE
ncbi:MAG: DUF3783 domain-containing protein [Ruminococcus sp.]|nr:DUF3783 domain-containing protein [Ruminococcus sp.]